MTDEQFGNLKRDDDELEGTFHVPRFAAWGAALDEKDPPDDRPAAEPDGSPTKGQLEARKQLAAYAGTLGGAAATMLNSVLGLIASRSAAPSEPAPSVDEEPDEDELRYRRGVCDLRIETTSPRAKPAKAQRDAWAAVVGRGDVLWDELLQQAFEIYQRQRPVRRHWWQAVYGDYLLDRRFPDVTTAEQFARLIRPWLFRIKPPADKAAASAEVTLLVRTTWDVDGFGVILRGGGIVEFAQVMDVINAPDRAPDTIDHPTFGRLKRIPSDDPMEYINEWEVPTEAGASGFANARRVANRPWLGRARFDPLLDFAMVADARAEYANNRDNADYPASRMAWEFADGEFEIRVYAPAGKPPSDAQAAAWTAFRSNQTEIAASLIDGVFRRYQESREVHRLNWKDRNINENIPLLTSPDGLRQLIQLRHIHVHPADAAGRVTVGLQFVAAYSYDGFSVLWRDGRLEEWGAWKAAEYRDRS